MSQSQPTPLARLWTDEDPDDQDAGSTRCTPETLLAFIDRSKVATGRLPTLRDCRHEFGGVLGPLVALWELQRTGRMPKEEPTKKAKVTNG